jgi:hypothetical protein
MKGHTTAFLLPWNKSFSCCKCNTHSYLKRCRACVSFKKVSSEFDAYVVHAGFAAVYSIFVFLRVLPIRERFRVLIAPISLALVLPCLG